jgi:hypothetical protein
LITRLSALEVPALRLRWAALFGAEPSPNFGRALLIGAIAYRLQEKASPSLKPAAQRLLDRIVDNRSSDVHLRSIRASKPVAFRALKLAKLLEN